MNKTAIKNYAIWARNTLIEAVGQRAFQYGITEKDCGDPMADSVNGFVLTTAEKKQRQALIAKIREKGYEQVMEEAAYTWFNRFIALRFMEVNGYLPTRVRVFTDEENAFKPQILSEATHLELDGLKLDRVIALKEANKTEELFKYLLITQCNALSTVLPGMFQKIEDYTELLLPDNLLRDGSVIEQMVTTIPEEDWTDQVQIIGWLYQYYNTEPKDKVFADLKKNIKITKENIPAATQLFTPDWIVHYMVENSLGRLWLEGHPNDALKSEWKYYLDEAEQEPEVQAQLATIRKEYAALKPEEIRVIDPCMGSGHILCVLFDVLVRIYEDYGYTAREAAVKIVENNLWGLDIDERAAQLSYFAVMMKARQYDRRFFTRKVQPHVYAIEESNGITSAPMHDMGLNLSQEEYSEAVKQAMLLVEEMHDAKEYGSIIHVTPCDWDLLRRFAVPREEEGQLHLDIHGEIEASSRLQQLIDIGECLAGKYSVVVTNPPYMTGSGMPTKLYEFVKKRFPDSKADLFAVFMESCGAMLKAHGFQAMITQHAWMFLTSFEKLRIKLRSCDIINMAHLGARAFDEIGGAVVQTTTFVIQSSHISGRKGIYCRLLDAQSEKGKEQAFLSGMNRYAASTDNFGKIPGSPFSYWVSENIYKIFDGENLDKRYDIKAGMCTGDNGKFILYWHEIDWTLSKYTSPDRYEYTPHNKGGEYRKWYGNRDVILKYSPKALAAMEHNAGFRHDGRDYYFREHLGWSKITSGASSFRYFEEGFTFDSAGLGLFPVAEQDIYVTLAFLNSKVAEELIALLNPTLNVTPMIVKKLPFTKRSDSENAVDLVKDNILLCKEDWDSFETSWDFKEHPFMAATRWADRDGEAITIRQGFESWKGVAEGRFHKLKENEEELNRIFIDIYGLRDELTPEVEDKDVTVRRADLGRDIRSFISYAVGCMFGRYSLYKNGLIFAGEPYSLDAWVEKMNDQPGIVSTEEIQRAYKNEGVVVNEMFFPDKDNIIPICDDEYFEDDIVGRFVKFIEVVYGKDTLEENLRFIADALGGKGSSREVIRSYFINDFYADHLKVYQKRPIYWLFDSGKKNGFKCLIYMHRYQPDTIARIRTDYVHEQQSRYRTAIADLEQRVEIAAPAERVKLSKQLQKLRDQATEVQKYEEKIHHLADQMIKIDLDDGVKVNYAKFEDVLAKIK